jgi:putative ABC transport system substrate-binding protein
MSRTRRRQFLAATGALLAVHLAHAQQPQKVRKIGFLSVGNTNSSYRKALPESLRRFGYEEGRNLIIEWRFAEYRLERLPLLAEELVQAKVELIIVLSNAALLAAHRATRTVPIVSWMFLPIEQGFIASHARPGGNITGLDLMPTETMFQKLWQLLKDVVPGAQRAAFLWDPNHSISRLYDDEFMRRIASTTGLTTIKVDMLGPKGLAGALDQIAAAQVDVLIVTAAEIYLPHHREIAAFASKHKLASISSYYLYPSNGGLLRYGPDRTAEVDQAMNYVDRILRGAKPADLPVEQPTKFELVLNMKTAKAIGLQLSPGFMAQVNQVIE